MPLYVGSNQIASASVGTASLTGAAVAALASPGTFTTIAISSGGGGGGGGVELDPLFSSVAMLLSFENEAGNGSLVDLSPANVPVQVVTSGPQLSTAFAKTGTSSLKMPLNSGRVSAAAEFYTGPLTLEMWIRPSANGWDPPTNWSSPEDKGINSVLYACYHTSGSTLMLTVTPAGAFLARSVFGYPGAYWNGGIAAGVWTHIAFVRNGGEAQVFVNGVGGAVASVPADSPISVPCDLLVNQVNDGVYVDDYRVTKAVRYPLGQNFTPPESLVVTLSPSLPSAKTVYTGEASLTPVVRTTAGVTVVSYQWEKSESGSSTFSAVSGATSSSLTLQNLTDAADSGDRYRVVVTLSDGQVAASNACTLTVDESGVNMDNRFRVRVPQATYLLLAAVDTTTGYWRMVASTGDDSGVIGSQYTQYSPYYWNTGSITMTGAGEKTVEVFSCDANGNPSGELEYVSFSGSSQAIIAADASGCTALKGFNLAGSQTPYGNYYSAAQLPRALVSVRAVGVSGNGGSYSQWGNYAANVSGGINVAAQSLSAAALNQLYTDLSAGTNTARIFVADNPGTSSDNPAIATAKGYTVFGS